MTISVVSHTHYMQMDKQPFWPQNVWGVFTLPKCVSNLQTHPQVFLLWVIIWTKLITENTFEYQTNLLKQIRGPKLLTKDTFRCVFIILIQPGTIVTAPHTFMDQNGCLPICKQEGRIAGEVMAHDILLRHNRRNYSFCIKPLVELWYQLLGRPVELNLEKLQHSYRISLLILVYTIVG
jgi:hypothetical protein